MYIGRKESDLPGRSWSSRIRGRNAIRFDEKHRSHKAALASNAEWLLQRTTAGSYDRINRPMIVTELEHIPVSAVYGSG
jgi:hypothetical protein